jgi:phosphate transport system permease protein
MSLFWLVVIILAIGAVGFVLGRQRALASAGGNAQHLHSLPIYYGMNGLLMAVVPALALIAVTLLAAPIYIENRVSAGIPEDAVAEGTTRGLMMSDVRRVADGLNKAVSQGAMSSDMSSSMRTDLTDVRARLGEVGVALGSDVSTVVLRAAQQYRAISAVASTLMSAGALLLALAGLGYAYVISTKDFRARNTVERGTLLILQFAAMVAILTTIGIVLSLIFNTFEFFRLYSASDFFFSTVWSPSFGGGSELGILPLLWGTLYISFIALAVAVPVGLFAAIYLSEYASRNVRAVAKPALEVLAGIPTIVYGLFALLTVGPFLMEVFGPDSVGFMRGASSVMTAGVVMGIMLIPFVSSLSDDIINSVPQAMRDGSLGLGATPSETVRQVVLPAALPGIVGAVLLAASRAIGETMIVVMGAGAAARLSLNPFEAMTTVTAKIVSQLTGDAEFTSPETLVAFALGMTLFVITLGMNVLALNIVRKYREQYE